MPGILYVVATPIGNLEDVTLRALRILREVSLIAAEDTRRTSRLLQHYSISTPTTSLHEHNEHAKAPRLIARLEAGESVALVSDAGTPAISDPGSRLVAAAHAAGIPVLPVPGPSAVTAAVSAAGLETTSFTFAGFPPDRSKARAQWLAWLAAQDVPVVFYEAPHRIHRALAEIQESAGDRRLGVGRELTKRHESFVVRPISAWVADPPPAKGEFVLVLFPPQEGSEAAEASVDEHRLASEFWQITKNGSLGRREGLRQVARRFGVSTRDVFNALERQPKSPV
jgi:16S rRNA (cytidine1402-2'-O)-methyltransferase